MWWVAWGLATLSISIGLAAYGRHGLVDEWSKIRWEIGIEYVRWTGVGLVLMAILRELKMNGQGLLWPERLLVSGNVIFSGIICLEALSPLTVQQSFLRSLPPVGGMLMMAGFAWMAIQIIRNPGEG